MIASNLLIIIKMIKKVFINLFVLKTVVRKFNLTIIIILLIFLTKEVNSCRMNSGFISSSLGKATTAVSNVESSLGNPAGFSDLKGIIIYVDVGEGDSVSQVSIGGFMAFEKWAIGIAEGIYENENSKLKEYIFSFERDINLRLAAGINLKHIAANDIIPNNLINELDIGLQLKITKDFWLDGAVYSKAYMDNGLYLPVESAIGAQYQFSSFNLSSDIIWIGKANIPGYDKENNILIGIGIHNVFSPGIGISLGNYCNFNFSSDEKDFSHFIVAFTFPDDINNGLSMGGGYSFDSKTKIGYGATKFK